MTTPTPTSLIKAAKLKYVSPDLTVANFPFPKKLQTVEFINFGKIVTTQEARDGLAKEGLVPASPWEVLNHIIKHPKDWDEKRCLACITNTDFYATFRRWSDERRVYVYRYAYVWLDSWFFGGVRKSTSPLKPSALDTSLVTLQLPKYVIDELKKAL